MTIFDQIEIEHLIEDLDAMLGFDKLNIDVNAFPKKEDFYKAVCEKAAEVCKNDSNKFKILLACAKIHEKIYNQKSDKKFEFCLGLAKDIEEKHEIFYSYAQVLFFRNDLKKAKKNIDVALSLVKKQDNKTLLLLSKILWRSGKILEAQAQLQKIITSQEDSKEVLSETYNLLGIIFGFIGLSEEAISYFEKSLQSATNNTLKGKIMGNLGNEFLKKGQYDKARQFLSKTLSISEYYGDNLGIVRANSNLGVLENRLGNYEKALLLYRYALDYNNETVKNKTEEGKINLNLGVVYAELGNFEASERCYLKSLEIKKIFSDEPGIKDVEKNMKMLEIRKQIKIELANKNGGFIFEESKSYNEMIANFDKHVIEEALNRAEFNVSKAAQKLDLPTSTLRSKMETLGIKPNKAK